MPDVLGYRGKVGLVVPSTNTVVQPESEAVRPPGVTNHVGRIPILERRLDTPEAYADHMRMMREGVTSAVAQVMTARPDHVIMGVALEAFTGGVAGAAAYQAELAAGAGVGVSMGSTATVAALRAYGARRIAVVTPHQPAGGATVRAYLEQAGFDVLGLADLRCATPLAIAEVTAAQLRAAIRGVDGAEVEALVVVGTNLASGVVAAEAERWLEKPVLAINPVTYWDALRRMGVADRVHGHGRVLEEH